MIYFGLAGGKYAAFIWPAYGAAVIAFAWMTLDTLGRARRWRRRVRELERRDLNAPRPSSAPSGPPPGGGR